jgi:peptidyl-tRNA hydrolase, PTH1 family
MLVDALAVAWNYPPFRRPWRWRARVSEGEFSGVAVSLVKPQTYMNRSGAALGPLLQRDAFDPSRDLLVVVDEVALPAGTFRIRPSGSDGGHNGLKSIAGRLASDRYPRLRIGVGPKEADEDQSDFVLSRFDADAFDSVQSRMSDMIGAVECWLSEGIDTAMNRYNRRGAQSD